MKLKKSSLLIVVFIVAVFVTAAIVGGTFLAVKLSDDGNEKVELTTQPEEDREGIESIDDSPEINDSNSAGFPYTARDGYIRNIVMSGENVAVLEDGCLTLLSQSGNVIFSQPHSYSSPMLKCAGDRILLYDKVSGFYRLFDKKGEYINGSLEEGHIITGDISDSGVFCLVSSSNGSSSYLTVFSKNGKRMEYKWKCSPEHIVGAALSPDGKNYAVSVLSAEEGKIVSKVYFLNNKITESPEPFILDSGAVCEIKFISNKNLSIVTDENRIIVNNSLEVQGYSTSTRFNQLKKIKSDLSGNTAALTTDLGLDSQSIVVFDKKNAEKYGKISEEGVKDIALNSGRLYVLGDGMVIFYDKKGVADGECLVNDRCALICAAGKYAYCAADTQLFRVSAE